jgi:mannosyltransferase
LRGRDPNRRSLILFAGTLIYCLVWLLFSRYIAPELIRSAYNGTSWPFLDRMITGQASHALSEYLTDWNVFAWHVLVALLLLGSVVMLLARPEVQDAFWGPEPTHGLGPNTTATGVGGEATRLSWRENLASLAQPRTALLFGGVLALSLFLRLVYLGAKSLSEDEIMSVLLARSSLLDFWNKVSNFEANMVLYYAILRFWIHLGQSEVAVRSLSVVFALAAVTALYWLGTRTFGRKIGILGALLLAINGFHIEYSQDARSYSLLVFLVTLSSLLFVESVQQGSRRNWIRYIVASALAIYAHIFAGFVLLAHWVSLLFLPVKQAPWRRLVSSTLAIGVLTLPMGLFLLFRNHGQQLAWVPKPSPRGFYDLFACLAGNPDDHTRLPLYGTAILLCTYLIPVVIAMLALAKSRSQSMDATEAWHLTFMLTWLWVPIVVVLAISMRSPAFWNRFLIICLPPFILLASYGFSRIRRVWLEVALMAVILGLTAPGLFTYYKASHKNWRGATQYVLSNQQPGDAILFCPDYYQQRFTYYLEREQKEGSVASDAQPVLLAASSGGSVASLLETLPARYDRVWFISDDDGKVFDRQKRLIRTSLATGFPGMPEEKRFPNVLVVDLYRK